MVLARTGVESEYRTSLVARKIKIRQQQQHQKTIIGEAKISASSPSSSSALCRPRFTSLKDSRELRGAAVTGSIGRRSSPLRLRPARIANCTRMMNDSAGGMSTVNGTNRVPLHPKVRKILVEDSKLVQPSASASSASAASAASTERKSLMMGSPVLSSSVRSRNSPVADRRASRSSCSSSTTERTCTETVAVAAVATLSRGAATACSLQQSSSAAYRKKPAVKSVVPRAKDVLSDAAALNNVTVVTSKKVTTSRTNRRRSSRTPSPVLSQYSRRANLEALDSYDVLVCPPIVTSTSTSSIAKSASVPTNLKAKAASNSPGILKRSSSFLASLARRTPSVDHIDVGSNSSSSSSSSITRGSFCSLLRRRPRAAGSPDSQRSNRSNSGAGGSPRKCVSFREDTSFQERSKGSDYRCSKKTAVHESKLYRKGVLQDRNNGCNSEENSFSSNKSSTTNLPLSWEESLGGPRALLGAAQDGDDELIKRIVALANKSGLANIQINAVDNSGRTAISYMAGNGSALMLEACLSFPGVDANLPDNEGNTPLHFAAQAGQTECLNILLQRCPTIEVDVRNSLGFTPLMKAAVQGRTKCAKVLLFAGANPTLRDHGRGLRAEQWARFCGRYVCSEVIERLARHKLLEKTTSCRWGSEPELAAQVLQGKLMPIPSMPVQPAPSGLKSKIRRVFRTSSNADKASFSLVSQLTSAALCASSPILPKPGDMSPVVKSLLRPLSVPQLRITLVAPQDIIEKTSEKCTTFTDKNENSMVKPPRTKKKNK